MRGSGCKVREGILIMSKNQNPISELKGLAKDVWADSVSSVELVKDIRRRADLEAKQTL